MDWIPYWITNVCKDDRDRAGCVLGRQCRGRAHSNDQFDPEPGEVRREGGKTIDLPLRPSILDKDVLSFDVPEASQRCAKGGGIRVWWGLGPQETDPVHLSRLLRPRGERRGEKAARDRHECASVQRVWDAGGGRGGLHGGRIVAE